MLTGGHRARALDAPLFAPDTYLRSAVHTTAKPGMSRAAPCASRTLRLDTSLLGFPGWFCWTETAGVSRRSNPMGADPESLRAGHDPPLRGLAAGQSGHAATPASRRPYALWLCPAETNAGPAAAWRRPASAWARPRTRALHGMGNPYGYGYGVDFGWIWIFFSEKFGVEWVMG